jgi:hypothetical protein
MMRSKGVKPLKTHDLKEILEIEGHKHLVELQKSLSYSGFDNPSVFISKGVLNGICIVTGIDYEVKKNYKIIFYKKLTESSFMRGNDRGKFWFEIQLDMTEEEADERIEAKNRVIREDSAMRRKVLG